MPTISDRRNFIVVYDPDQLAVIAWDGHLSTGALTIGAISNTAFQANAGTNLNTSALALEAGHLATIDGKVPALGQALAASSVPVILPSATIATLTPLTTLTAVTSITTPISSKTDLTPSAPTVATVGIASAAAVTAQATRKGLIVRNLSTTGQRISLGFGQTAVLDSGVTLYPQDTFRMDEYDFDLGAVNAIASAASASLAVQEYLT